MKKKKGQTLTFIITFMATFAALCGIVAVAFATGDLNGSGESSQVSSQAEYLPLYEHEQNILVICCDWRGGGAKLFGILKINPVKQKFNISVLPLQTLSTVNIRTDTLGGHYDYGGSPMAVEAVQNACGIKINRYVKFALDDLYGLIDELGGVEYDVQQPAGSVNKGFQTLDGRRMFELIFAQQEPEKQARFATDIFVKLVNSNLKNFLKNRGDEFFELVTQNSDTTLTAFDYEYRKQALAYILKKDKPGDGVKIGGEYDLENEEFSLSEESLTELQSVFWLNEA